MISKNASHTHIYTIAGIPKTICNIRLATSSSCALNEASLYNWSGFRLRYARFLMFITRIMLKCAVYAQWIENVPGRRGNQSWQYWSSKEDRSHSIQKKRRERRWNTALFICFVYIFVNPPNFSRYHPTKSELKQLASSWFHLFSLKVKSGLKFCFLIWLAQQRIGICFLLDCYSRTSSLFR